MINGAIVFLKIKINGIQSQIVLGFEHQSRTCLPCIKGGSAFCSVCDLCNVF